MLMRQLSMIKSVVVCISNSYMHAYTRIISGYVCVCVCVCVYAIGIDIGATA